MKKEILLATLATLFIAGCAGPITNIFQQPITFLGGTGLVMTDFSSDQTAVYGGQTNRIMVTVTNKGGHSVPDAESLVYLTGSALEPAGDDTIFWTTGDTLIRKFNTEMKPADIVGDVPATEKMITWSLTAPNISKGEQNNYLFIGRVYYDYQTKVTGNIWVYSQAEWDAAKAAGTTLNKATWSASAGPVSVMAYVTQDPVVLYDTENSFTLIVKVGNAGGGVLYSDDTIDYSTTNPDNLNLTTDQINRVDIGVNLAGTDLSNECTGVQELIGGKDITLSCDITITPPATFQSFPITVTADYGYFTERTASVVVTGR